MAQAAAETIRRLHRYALGKPGVPVVVADIDAVIHDDRGVAAMTAAIAASMPVPGVISLARRQRHPAVAAVAPVTTVAAESDAEAKARVVTETEEGHQGRPPGVMIAARARIPAPTVVRVAEPAPVVIRGPAPGLVADPGPAIVIEPRPAAMAIGSPAAAHAREPDVAVAGNVLPASVVVEVLAAGDTPAQPPIAVRVVQHFVAALIPFIPGVLVRGAHDAVTHPAVFVPPDDHPHPLLEFLDAIGRSDLGASLADGDRNLVLVEHINAIASILLRTHDDQRRFDVDIRFAAPQFAVVDDAAFHLNPELALAQIGQMNFGRFAQPNQIGVVELQLDP